MLYKIQNYCRDLFISKSIDLPPRGSGKIVSRMSKNDFLKLVNQTNTHVVRYLCELNMTSKTEKFSDEKVKNVEVLKDSIKSFYFSHRGFEINNFIIDCIKKYVIERENPTEGKLLFRDNMILSDNFLYYFTDSIRVWHVSRGIDTGLSYKSLGKLLDHYGAEKAEQIKKGLETNLVGKTCCVCKKEFNIHKAIDGLKNFDNNDLFFDGYIDTWTNDWVHYRCEEEYIKTKIAKDKLFENYNSAKMQICLNEMLYLPQQ